MPAIPELLVTVDDEQLTDLTLALTNFRGNEDWSSDFAAAATWDGNSVGFQFHLGAEWEAQEFDDGPSAVWGTLTLVRAGDASDRFLRALAEVYDLEDAPARMADFVEFSAASLSGHPLHVKQGPLRMKLFHNADEEERYAELYCIIDFQKGRIQFRESSTDYRGALIDALCAPEPA